jgi:hypothetical protein
VKARLKSKVLGKKYLSKLSFWIFYIFAYLSQDIIHHQNKYILSLRGVTGLHVETNKFKILDIWLAVRHNITFLLLPA